MSAPTLPELRPLELGEILDRSATFWRSHFKALFALALGFQLALYAIVKAFTVRLGGVELTALSSLPDTPSLIRLAAWAVVLAVAYVFIALCAQVAASRYVVQHALGEPLSPGAALRFTLSRMWTATSSAFWLLLWAMLAALAVAVPYGLFIGLVTSRAIRLGTVVGVVVMGSLVVLVLIAAIWVAVAVWLRALMLGPIVATEERGGFASFRRTGRLLAGRVAPGFFGRTRVRATILLAVVGVILIVVGVISGLPTLIVTTLYSHGGLLNPGARLTVPQAVLVPAELFQVTMESVFSPISWVFAAIFYLDLRVRKEGLDLERKLSAMPTE